MEETGFNWTISRVEEAWAWVVTDPADGAALVAGQAPSRAVAAAMVVRALARGMTDEAPRELAA